MRRNWPVAMVMMMGVVACGAEHSPAANDSDSTETEGAPEDDVRRTPESDSGESEEGGEPPVEEGSGSGESGCVDCELECSGDEDCDVGSVCDENNSCQALAQVPGCVDRPLIQIGELEAGIITSLSFVDADGDGAAELAVGHPSGLDLVLPEETVHVLDATDGPVLDVVVGDFNGDEVDDLLVADPTALTLVTLTGGGVYEKSTLPAAPRKLAALGWNASDGADDVAVLLQTGGVEVRVGGSSWGDVLALNASNGSDLAVGDVDGDGLGDVAVESAGRTPIFFGNVDGDYATDLVFGDDGLPANGIVAGHFADPMPTAILRHRDIVGTWTLVEGGHQDQTFRSQALLAAGLTSAAGDVDGDGFDDFVLADLWEITVAFGGATHGGLLDCSTSHGLTIPGSMLAVGDRDGDGRAEIATTHGVYISLFAMP